MDNAAHGNTSHRHAVSGSNGGLASRLQSVTCLYPPWGYDVSTLSIGVSQESNVCRAVWIVFKSFNDRGDTIFVAFKINYSVLLLVATTNVPGCDPTTVVAAA
jgi:hypothetical protein